MTVFCQVAGRFEGGPLDAGLRRLLEDAFGHDLGAVRVHHSEQADRHCRAWGAHALAFGRHVLFRRDAYAPGSEGGLWLLAHEVAHTVRQSIGLDRPGVRYEREADAAADAVLAGRRFVWGAPTGPARPVVQRHSSWEHRLLGDIPVSLMQDIADGALAGAEPHQVAARRELLAKERALMELWYQDPTAVDADRWKKHYRSVFPEVKTVVLEPEQGKKGSLLVSLGELNTLADYLPDADAIEDCPYDLLVAILQTVREQSSRQYKSALGRDSILQWSRKAFKHSLGLSYFDNTLRNARETRSFNNATKKFLADNKVSDRYNSVLCRNACHFAPYSWYRWQIFYLRARTCAETYHTSRDAKDERKIWVNLGFADHFLQDSFAAGHLINKTRIMQWYIDWLSTSQFSRGVGEWASVRTMSSTEQKLLHAPDLYDPKYVDSIREMRPKGETGNSWVTDPQTAEEEQTLALRMQRCGVRTTAAELDEKYAYACFLEFLNNSVVQLSSNVVHDHLNRTSLHVRNKKQEDFVVWGDDTLIKSGQGMVIARRAAQLSQQSIVDLMEKGSTTTTTRDIFDLFPREVKVGTKWLGLDDWHDQSLKTMCEQQLFCRRRDLAKSLVLYSVARHMEWPSKDYETLTEYRRSEDKKRGKKTILDRVPEGPTAVWA
ncbi:DUF4157 domain-containing protein [Streptomyces sp. NPDC052020]|uniref:eCIS core domain-containing protein n=1 Tax=Streptomyces sp. NPDC052020 TaxID=3155677 RepID=UPI0034322617